MSEKKKYKIDQSPLYKINSHIKLTECLNLKNKKTIKKLVKNGDRNYYVSKLSCGRKIQVPLAQLNRVHRRINSLLSRLESPDYLNSGVKNRSNIKNANDHVGDYAVLKIDIKNFYQSITEEQVARCFVKSFRCSKDVSNTLAKLCCHSHHLPTGSSISQSLAYIVNRPIFDHINIYSKARDIKFTCYVDDLTFSGKVIPKDFKGYITSYIKKNRGYDCHKIRMHNSQTPKYITGAVIQGNTLKVPNKQRKRISDLLNRCNYMSVNYTPDDERLIECFQRLQGHVFCAAQVNSRYRQLGYKIVKKRRDMGISALNQNTYKKKIETV